jgi:hypothetical protein
MRPKAAVTRTERLILLYNEDEFKRLKLLFAKSLCHSISGYVRKVSLEDPVEIAVRNESFDDFVGEIIQLRKEMVSLRKEAAFTPEQLEKVIRMQEDIKTIINKIVELCMPQ